MYVCCCSMAKSCPTLCDPIDCSTPGSYVLHYLPEFAQIHVHWVGDAIQPSHPLLPLLLLPSIFPSISVFPNESVLRIRMANYWSFSFSISPSNEYSGLFSFRIDWFDLLAVPGTLKSVLQHHSSKASILWCSVFFTVQLSQPYMTTEKTIAMTIRTFVVQVMSLLFNTVYVCHSFPSKEQASLNFMATVTMLNDFGVQEKKICHWCHFFPFFCNEAMRLDAMTIVFWMLKFYPIFSPSSFTFIKRLFSTSSLSAIRVVSSAYLRLLIFLPAILIPACDSFSPAFHMVYLPSFMGNLCPSFE